MQIFVGFLVACKAMPCIYRCSELQFQITAKLWELCSQLFEVCAHDLWSQYFMIQSSALEYSTAKLCRVLKLSSRALLWNVEVKPASRFMCSIFTAEGCNLWWFACYFHAIPLFFIIYACMALPCIQTQNKQQMQQMLHASTYYFSGDEL